MLLAGSVVVVAVGLSFGESKRERGRVRVALSSTKVYRDTIGASYAERGRMPTSLTELGIPASLVIESGAADDDLPRSVEVAMKIDSGQLIVLFEKNQGKVAGRWLSFGASAERGQLECKQSSVPKDLLIRTICEGASGPD